MLQQLDAVIATPLARDCRLYAYIYTEGSCVKGEKGTGMGTACHAQGNSGEACPRVQWQMDPINAQRLEPRIMHLNAISTRCWRSCSAPGSICHVASAAETQGADDVTAVQPSCIRPPARLPHNKASRSRRKASCRPAFLGHPCPRQVIKPGPFALDRPQAAPAKGAERPPDAVQAGLWRAHAMAKRPSYSVSMAAGRPLAPAPGGRLPSCRMPEDSLASGRN